MPTPSRRSTKCYQPGCGKEKKPGRSKYCYRHAYEAAQRALAQVRSGKNKVV